MRNSQKSLDEIKERLAARGLIDARCATRAPRSCRTTVAFPTTAVLRAASRTRAASGQRRG